MVMAVVLLCMVVVTYPRDPESLYRNPYNDRPLEKKDPGGGCVLQQMHRLFQTMYSILE